MSPGIISIAAVAAAEDVVVVVVVVVVIVVVGSQDYIGSFSRQISCLRGSIEKAGLSESDIKPT
jgi:hypothetical protein